MEVVFCDNHILIVEKEAGMPTQKTEGAPIDVETLAKKWVKEKFKKKGDVFLHAVHRLDSVVSGLVLFARTSKALSRLNEQMRERKIKKIYVAKVEGVLKEEEGTFKHFLRHGDFRAHVVPQNHPEAKEAVLTYRILKRGGDKTLVEITLLTGRYHQIRAQFSQMGHPVVGDKKYGSKTSSKAICLHHSRLEFTHPVTLEPLIFESPVPFKN